MSDGRIHGFARRWSRRKLDHRARRRQERTHEEAATTIKGVPDEQFADFDFDTLNFESDYRQFLSNAVSDQVRNKALQRLWTSSDLIAQPDDLDEFREDFRDEAKAAGVVRSAYRIGRGFLEDEDHGHGNVKARDVGENEVRNNTEPDTVGTDEAGSKMTTDSARNGVIESEQQ